MATFDYKSGCLHGEAVPLEAVAQRFGTPTYVYSRAAILENYRRLADGLARIPNLICYSVKANSNLNILRLLGEAGAGFDIVSAGELTRVLRAGADPSRVVFSGVGKTAEEIDAGLEAGILMFNVESGGELEVLEGRAKALGKAAALSIRVNPDVVAETHPYISTGQIVHKFGVPKNEAIELYRRVARSASLRARGVTCHIGSQILEVEPFHKALDEILEVARAVREVAPATEFLDIGGGFGIPYQGEKPLAHERLFEGLESRLRGTPYRLVIEPGRSIVGDAGVLLARVLYVKRNAQKNFIVVDAGMNDLMRPTLYGSYHEIVPVVRRSAETLTADVVGPLCETGDFLAQGRPMPDVEPGDLLAILTAGAYGYVLASNYNTRPRPAEVLIDGDQAGLIRVRERLEDLMAGETA
ncbi:MAG: diaminopimelate decarboxylase [Acidobacteria bacterium]|nr:diaminopimelate decarboxylase [Acidobacteriota bacterium]